jgi:aminopeptidase N
MPGTVKFRDLDRDPRFCLHTATVDTWVSDGDVKLWGVVDDIADKDVHQRFAAWFFDESGMDFRGQEFDHLFAADVIGASAIESDGEQLLITIWKPGEPERVTVKKS